MISKDWFKNAIDTLSTELDATREDSDRTTCSYVFREERIGLVVRQATPDDAAIIGAIGARAFRDVYASALHPADLMGNLNELFAEERLRDVLSSKDSYCMLALWDGAACGFAHLQTTGPHAERGNELPIELRSLFVAPDWVGKGVGSALLGACLRIASDRGYHTIWARLLRDNAKALTLFRRAGFVTVGNEVAPVGKRSKTSLLVLCRRLAPLGGQATAKRERLFC